MCTIAEFLFEFLIISLGERFSILQNAQLFCCLPWKLSAMLESAKIIPFALFMIHSDFTQFLKWIRFSTLRSNRALKLWILAFSNIHRALLRFLQWSLKTLNFNIETFIPLSKIKTCIQGLEDRTYISDTFKVIFAIKVRSSENRIRRGLNAIFVLLYSRSTFLANSWWNPYLQS